jgi:hypothetical protein
LVGWAAATFSSWEQPAASETANRTDMGSESASAGGLAAARLIRMERISDLL